MRALPSARSARRVIEAASTSLSDVDVLVNLLPVELQPKEGEVPVIWSTADNANAKKDGKEQTRLAIARTIAMNLTAPNVIVLKAEAKNFPKPNARTVEMVALNEGDDAVLKHVDKVQNIAA